MPKRISNKLKSPNQITAALVASSTQEDTRTDPVILSKVMAEMGRKGGKIGGKRSLETMSIGARKKRAKKAAKARWSKAAD